MNQIIPADVGRFILEQIDSIAELEAVLLLRESPDTWWDCQSVAARLYISEDSCLTVLAGLCKRRLLLAQEATDGCGRTYRYRPETGDLREMVDRLASYYSKHIVPVSNLVHAKARTHIEGFAQAFKFTPKE